MMYILFSIFIPDTVTITSLEEVPFERIRKLDQEEKSQVDQCI